MLKVKRFINELMTSNCYVVYDMNTKHCLVIDPASEKALREISFIEENELKLDYIVLTHEHTDHTWGVNALKDKYPNAKILCSKACNVHAKKASRVYFLLYYDNPDYRYVIKPADVVISDKEQHIKWNETDISFLLTPGHSYGSMCIEIEGSLFTGDTIMPFKPYFNGRDSDKKNWDQSIKCIQEKFDEETVIYPGHGDSLTLKKWGNTEY